VKSSVKTMIIQLGFTNCYLIKGKHFLLIDTGKPGSESKFLKSLNQKNIDPSDIKSILITHGHWDHAGSLEAIKTITGAQAMIHILEKEWVEQGLIKAPSGLVPAGIVMHFLMNVFSPLVHMPESTIDITLSHFPYSLNDSEIPGKIIHTPGHTKGSLSLVLDSGEAFVGDLAMNGFPQFRKNGVPVVGDSLEEVKNSWKILLNENVKIIYPAHGDPFSAKILENTLRNI